MLGDNCCKNCYKENKVLECIPKTSVEAYKEAYELF